MCQISKLSKKPRAIYRDCYAELLRRAGVKTLSNQEIRRMLAENGGCISKRHLTVVK